MNALADAERIAAHRWDRWEEGAPAEYWGLSARMTVAALLLMYGAWLAATAGAIASVMAFLEKEEEHQR